MQSQRSRALDLYKKLYRNLRMASMRKGEESYVDILRSEFRQHSVSDSKYCMQKNEMMFMARTLSTYLTSTKQTLQLYAKYCRGERSIEEAANIVGLRLPKQYQGPSTAAKK
ncbi:hypothetical protein BpHYR1_022087 [Brachionus plicatilis]|uniref:Protein FMC1 homolog n=1 Tax=Brachionus plicatilis TaxID=10195 RepID=A0A3M7SVQ8_BRAPC|nr:hypothetical protein BpHYR1_022087 [Brachionus plicatilis]